MVDYLTNFARTGDPNGADLPQWQTVTAQQTDFLRLGEEPTHMGSVDAVSYTHLDVYKRQDPIRAERFIFFHGAFYLLRVFHSVYHGTKSIWTALFRKKP